MDPFQVPQKTSIATFSNLLTNSSPNILLQDFSIFQLFPVLKITFLQNVLALLAPFAKFIGLPLGLGVYSCSYSSKHQ